MKQYQVVRTDEAGNKTVAADFKEKKDAQAWIHERGNYGQTGFTIEES